MSLPDDPHHPPTGPNAPGSGGLGVPGVAPAQPQGKPSAAVQTELRGSGLLLGGRIVAIGLNFLVQVLMVRFLTRGEYGSFSFAMSATALAANFNLLGMARAMSRFGPLYGERKDSAELMQAIALVLGALVSLGVVGVTLALLFNGAWQPLLTDNPLSQELLVLLVALTPLMAIDAVLEVLAAAFAGARAIFMRRHLLTPILRLAAVLTVMALGQGPRMLAACYLGAAVVGLLAYLAVLQKALKARGARWRMPKVATAKPIVRYGFSMLLLDLAGVSILHLPVVVLEYARGANAVAGLRAVVPLATLVLVVFQSMKLLYVPLATRSFERGGREDLTHAFWSASKWIGLLSFPIFAVCVFLSPFAVTTIFGQRYADASSLAAIMAVGYYMHAILGVNTLTLQALGEGRRLRTVAGVGIATAVVANLILVPLYGAVGAALSTTLTLLAHDLTAAYLVWKRQRIDRAPAGFFQPYAWVLGVSLVLLVSVTLLDPPQWLAVTLVVAGIATVWQAGRKSLDLLTTFPELKRVPGLRRLIS